MGRKTRKILKFVTLFLLLEVITAHDFTTQCSPGCKCIWVSGNKEANCTNASFDRIPHNLSTEIQNLHLEENNLYEIEQYAFQNVGLSNLKKLFLKKCKLQDINKDGFSGLNIMITLDLSDNEIRALHPDTFKDLYKIRWIFLSNNLITKLENGLFRQLPQLQSLHLSNNRISQIAINTFSDLPTLREIRLNNNKLEHMKEDTFASIVKLTELELHNNPWRCDCYLQSFRNWIKSRNSFTTPTCAEPPTLNGKLWSSLDSDDFACKPIILYSTVGSVLRSSDDNITLPCHVSGNPIPEVSWVLNSKVIEGNNHKGKYNISQSINGNSKWYNLTILDSDGSDNGEYLCAAKNSGGVEETKVTLFVTHMSPGMSTPAVIEGNMMSVLIGICSSAAILLIILIILCYCCCRKRMSEKKKKADASNGEALIEGSVIPEMEKSLINTINPVTKPPRRYDAPPSITSGGTEMSELNKTLLDIDSVYAAHDEEKHSLDFEIDPSKRSHEMLNYGRQDRAYIPPDLLSFPARAPQISPAASSASTVPDTSRLPPQLNPISPVHSPIYGTNPNLFRTLPYSRSQSPFTAAITPPVVTPRQGYVTIPRRPRVPSWSSTASTQILPSSEAQEPLYDNLGLRTTANGSSVLSLNKSGLEQPMSPMRGRPLPATPGVLQNPQTIYYTPIEEQMAQSPPLSPQYVMNPRNSISSQLSTQLSTPGPQEPTNARMSWNANKASTPLIEPKKVLFPNDSMSEMGTIIRRGNKPETGSLRRNPKTPIKDINMLSPKTSPIKDENRNNESNVSLNQSGTLGRSGKIPPRPPPKPKKKPNLIDTTNEQPIFEDEGEDGTEV